MSTTDWNDIGDWLTHQHKIVEQGFRNRYEHLRFSVEFSKIIITSLIGINSGGLVAIPAYASFFGFKPDRASILLPPAALFSIGLVSAMLCAYFTYENWMIWSRQAMAESKEAVQQMTELRGHLTGDANLVEIARQRLGEMKKAALVFNAQINASFRYGQVFGWVSMGLFVVGGVTLALGHS